MFSLKNSACKGLKLHELTGENSYHPGISSTIVNNVILFLYLLVRKLRSIGCQASTKFWIHLALAPLLYIISPYLSWETTSLCRPPWEVVFLERFHCVSSLQGGWYREHLFACAECTDRYIGMCQRCLFASGQTILLNDQSDRSKALRSIIDRKANLRSIICRSFIIVKWTGLLLWKQYIIITVRLGIWDNSHLL